MLKKKAQESFLGPLLAAYSAPLLILSTLSTLTISVISPWTIFPTGILITAFGTAFLYTCFARQIGNMGQDATQVVNSLELEERTKEITSLKTQLEALNSEVQNEKSIAADASLKVLQHEDLICTLQKELQKSQLEAFSLQKQGVSLQDDYHLYKTQAEEKILHQSHLIEEHKITIDELKQNLDEKRQCVMSLTDKIGDLSYELKALLKLEEAPKQQEEALFAVMGDSAKVIQHPSSIKLKDEAPPKLPPLETVRKGEFGSDKDKLYKACLNEAQKMTGVGNFAHVPNNPNEAFSESYSLDLRRFHDSFKEEKNALILLYSTSDERLLFVNDWVSSILNRTPEKFIHQFSEVIQPSFEKWVLEHSNKSGAAETPQEFTLLNAQGHSIAFKADIGLIPSGTFKRHILAVLTAK